MNGDSRVTLRWQAAISSSSSVRSASIVACARLATVSSCSASSAAPLANRHPRWAVSAAVAAATAYTWADSRA